MSPPPATPTARVVPRLGAGESGRFAARWSRLLLTGATGFLGMELLVRLLEQTDREVIALIRAPDDAAAAERLDGVLATLFSPEHQPAPGRVRAVAADLEQPGLGLAPEVGDALVADVTTVVHCAASVSFALPLEDARRINVEGTRGVLELAARAPGLEQLVHVSTAYVAGDRPGRAFEHEGDLGQTPRNTYEQTKLEAEALVLRERPARRDPAPEHRRRRQPHRLDAGLQRHLLAAAGLRTRGALQRRRGPRRPGRRRPGRRGGRRVARR